MMEIVKKDGASCVVVYSFSRFARSTTHMLSGLETMKAHDCNFCSLTEKIDTNSPIGKSRLRYYIGGRGPQEGPHRGARKKRTCERTRKGKINRPEEIARL